MSCTLRVTELMLILTKFVGKGATRICFEHPDYFDKCVKIAVRFKDNYLLVRELRTYSYIKMDLGDYLIDYEPQLVDTNQGKGLVCSLLRDDNGEFSKTLDYYFSKKMLHNDIISQLWHFAYCLIERDIFFYDFNLKNFVVQIKNGQYKLFYTDLKSFEKNKSWTFLKLEKVITPLARYIMIRRLKRLFSFLGIPAFDC